MKFYKQTRGLASRLSLWLTIVVVVGVAAASSLGMFMPDRAFADPQSDAQVKCGQQHCVVANVSGDTSGITVYAVHQTGDQAHYVMVPFETSKTLYGNFTDVQPPHGCTRGADCGNQAIFKLYVIVERSSKIVCKDTTVIIDGQENGPPVNFVVPSGTNQSACNGSTTGGGGGGSGGTGGGGGGTTATVTGKIITQYVNDKQRPGANAVGESQNVFTLFNTQGVDAGVAELNDDGTFKNPPNISVPVGSYCMSGLVAGEAGITFQYKLAKVPIAGGNDDLTVYLVRQQSGQIQVTVKDKSGKTIASGNDKDHSSCDNVNVLTDLAFPPAPAARTYKKGCNIEQSPTGWLFCQMIKGFAVAGNQLDKYINALLTLPTSQIFDTSNPSGNAYHTAWSNFRNIALAIMVLAALVMVVSQAMGLEIMDAYTVRKVLPRLLIAAIVISISWSLMEYAVSLTNDAGGAIRDIIYEPFSKIDGGNFGLRGGGGALAGILLLPGIVALKFSGVTSLISTAFIALFIGFLVMILREIAVTILIILAPVAIACFILPNTQKAYKLWWESFSKALLMFPIIAAFIAAGRVFAVTSYALSKNAPGGLGAVYEVISFVSYFIPYFLLPLTVRFAGGFVAALGGSMNNMTRGPLDLLKQGRKKRMAKSRTELADGSYLKGSGRRAEKFNALTAGIAAIPQAGLNPKLMRKRAGARTAARRLRAVHDIRANDPAFSLYGGNDDVLEAIFNTDGSDNAIYSYLTAPRGPENKPLMNEHNAQIATAQVRATRRRVPGGIAALRQAAVVDNSTTGTGYRHGIGQLLQAINKVSGDNINMSANLLHEARHLAAEARRFDLSEGDIEHAEEAMDELRRAGNTDAAANDITGHLNKELMQSIDPRKLMTARVEALELLAPHMTDGLSKAVASGDKKAISREAAKISGVYDRAASGSKELATLFGDEVMAKTFPIDGKQMTVEKLIEQQVRESNPDYLEMRHELNMAELEASGTAEQIAAARAAFEEQGH